MTRNAAANNRKIQYWEPDESGCCASVASENVMWPPAGVDITPSATAPASISSDPTSV
ncbi:MAG TPA: hypothetical protein VGI67_05250 [Thermoleophilaceae bacterium]